MEVESGSVDYKEEKKNGQHLTNVKWAKSGLGYPLVANKPVFFPLQYETRCRPSKSLFLSYFWFLPHLPNQKKKK